MIKKLTKYCDLHITFIKNCLMKELEFRANYFIMVAATVFLNIYFLIFYLVLVDRLGDNFLGWNKYQLLFFTATEIICHSSFMAFCFYNIFSLPDQVRTGNFDFILIKPVSARFMISTRNFNFAACTQIVFGIGLALYSAIKLSISVSFFKIVIYVLLILNSLMIMYLIGFCLMVLSFFFTKVSSSGSILPYRGFFAIYWFARCPENIFSNSVITIFTYVFPVMLIINLPAKWIVKSVDPKTLVWAFIFSIIFFVASQLLWKSGLRKYQSASS